jgi:hypothetical protein
MCMMVVYGRRWPLSSLECCSGLGLGSFHPLLGGGSCNAEIGRRFPIDKPEVAQERDVVLSFR